MTCTSFAGEALAERLLHSTVGALELFGIHLGSVLGLYAALQKGGPQTPPQLARSAGIAPRYAREWLEQQAVAGLLAVEDPTAEADARRYRLPPQHEKVLLDAEHPDHLAPLARMVTGVASTLPRVAEAYRTGGGVAFGDFALDLREGQGAINRPLFSRDLTGSWIPAVPDVHERLKSAPPARVADVGCGCGWSALAVAGAYPGCEVVGWDLDAEAIADARRQAAARGARVRFECRDAVELAGEGPFDLILVLEALHDMGRPSAVLASLRRALAPGGSVLVAEERVAERFTAPGDELERLMYGWSITACLPGALAEGADPDCAVGTAIRPATVRRLAAKAGFAATEVLPIANDLFRLYRLKVED